ncbi:MAG: TatD family hydrolase [Bacteroidales bacterium]|jgi:TatD DNase family protein|nr:TatD family hydrolase [Bacteroidales bacterium]MDD4258114.1 TatD family hydrolase [Bacteroidales bacterium]MDD4655163.1 TatD family hydrolase [Bacteroidales bacterium]MDD4827726.1 TatD family hydrolase [Bacteroidales bacterium]
MIDTHTHLYDQAFDPDRAEVVARARAAGVSACILPAIDQSTWQAQQACSGFFSGFCHSASGLHPTSVNENFREELDFARQTLPGAVAVGEIGIDAYWSREFLKEQVEVFEEQLSWAAEKDLPVIIHCRSAFPELLESLRRTRSSGLRGILHAWSGSTEVFTEANRYGHFLMGIGGVITYKNTHLVNVLQKTSLTEIVLETDAPWLTPSPFRGHRNESSYLTYILAKVAEIKGLSPEETDSRTTQNALSLFNLKPCNE